MSPGWAAARTGIWGRPSPPGSGHLVRRNACVLRYGQRSVVGHPLSEASPTNPQQTQTHVSAALIAFFALLVMLPLPVSIWLFTSCQSSLLTWKELLAAVAF